MAYDAYTAEQYRKAVQPALNVVFDLLESQLHAGVDEGVIEQEIFDLVMSHPEWWVGGEPSRGVFRKRSSVVGDPSFLLSQAYIGLYRAHNEDNGDYLREFGEAGWRILERASHRAVEWRASLEHNPSALAAAQERQWGPMR